MVEPDPRQITKTSKSQTEPGLFFVLLLLLLLLDSCYYCLAGTPPLPPGAAAGSNKQAGAGISRPGSAADQAGINPVLAAALQLHEARPPTPLGVADYAAMFRAVTPEVCGNGNQNCCQLQGMFIVGCSLQAQSTLV